MTPTLMDVDNKDDDIDDNNYNDDDNNDDDEDETMKMTTILIKTMTTMLKTKMMLMTKTTMLRTKIMLVTKTCCCSIAETLSFTSSSLSCRCPGGQSGSFHHHGNIDGH